MVKHYEFTDRLRDFHGNLAPVGMYVQAVDYQELRSMQRAIDKDLLCLQRIEDELRASLAADNDLFQQRWREWQSERDTLVDRVQRLEAALKEVLYFEPVINGDYAVMEAIPALRKIAVVALVATVETPCNHDLQSAEKTLKAVMDGSLNGFYCTVCNQRWGFPVETFVPTGAGGNPDAFVCCEGVGKHKPGCPMETEVNQGEENG